MIPASSSAPSNNRTAQRPVFPISHRAQEKICQEVHDYLVRKKIQKLKEAVRQFSQYIKQILK